jgi:hypothetical protein
MSITCALQGRPKQKPITIAQYFNTLFIVRHKDKEQYTNPIWNINIVQPLMEFNTQISNAIKP